MASGGHQLEPSSDAIEEAGHLLIANGSIVMRAMTYARIFIRRQEHRSPEAAGLAGIEQDELGDLVMSLAAILHDEKTEDVTERQIQNTVGWMYRQFPD